MRPFSALPNRVLISLLAVLFCFLSLAFFLPRWTLFFLGFGTVFTAAGALIVAYEASVRRRGFVPRPLPRPFSNALWTGAPLITVLALLCSPDITGQDAGELGASAYSLGVPHPTGFPLFCMVEKAFSLLPFAQIFYRLTFACAFFMGLAAALASPPGISRFGGVLAALAFLSASAPWQHAVTTEVYALSCLGLAATVLCGQMAITRKDARWLGLSWLLVGLGFGGHVTWVVEGAFFATLCTLYMLRVLGYRALLFPIVFIFGTLVVAYLPVAAARDPVLNWGDPSSLKNFIEHLTAQRIRQAFRADIGLANATIMLIRLQVLGKILWDSLSAILPLIIVGIIFLFKNSPVFALGLLGVGALDVLYALFINPMGVRDLQTPVHVFFVASYFVASAFFAISGVQKTFLRRAACTIAALAVGFQFLYAPIERDRRHVYAPRLLLSEFLATAPPFSSLLTNSDDLSALALAFQEVENARPDLLLLIRPHLGDQRQVLRRIGKARVTQADEALILLAQSQNYPAEPNQAEALLLPKLQGRGQVFIETGEAEGDAAIRKHLLPGFPAYRFVPDPVTKEDVERAAKIFIAKARSLVGMADQPTRAFLGSSVRLVGAHLAHFELIDLALKATKVALSVQDTDAPTWHNLGVLYAAKGDLESALGAFQVAVRLDKAYLRGWRSLAKYARMANRPDIVDMAEKQIKALSRGP